MNSAMTPRVLMAQKNCGHYFPEWVTTLPFQWVMDIEWPAINLKMYSHLVVIEDLGTFHRCFDPEHTAYTLPESLTDALIIYQGNETTPSNGCTALLDGFKAANKPRIFWPHHDTPEHQRAYLGYSHVLQSTAQSSLTLQPLL